MQSSSKFVVQQFAACLKQQNVKNIVISPGSRNAPLTIQFTGDNFFDCYSLVDERSAAFFALGLAQKSKTPTVLCCTSGSAVVNYYPAIVEAFYQNIPLIVLSADRPKQLIDKFDGQTIRQHKVFDQHVLASLDFDGDLAKLSTTQIKKIQKSIQDCSINKSPIHFNVSFEEPLYEMEESKKIDLPELEIQKHKNPSQKDLDEFSSLWEKCNKKIVLVGCQELNPKLNDLLEKRVEAEECIVFCETTSNLNSSKFFHHIDRLIFGLDFEQLADLRPELILTIGQNLISKKIKDFLRKEKPKYHFHLDPFWQPDTFFSLTHNLPYQATDFLQKIESKVFQKNTEYISLWKKLKQTKDKKHLEFLEKTTFSDFKVFQIIQENLDKNINLHFGNSASIRYAQIFDFFLFAETHCNRGVSGIDGCTGTAIGSAVLDKQKPTVLITGDLSFFYDSNSLWNKYIPKDFCIIILNNGGGNIFKIIPGPDKSPALDEFFATQHNRDASFFAKSYNFDYQKVNNESDLKNALKNLLKNSKNPSILEINTTEIENHKVLKSYFQSLN